MTVITGFSGAFSAEKSAGLLAEVLRLSLLQGQYHNLVCIEPMRTKTTLVQTKVALRANGSYPQYR